MPKELRTPSAEPKVLGEDSTILRIKNLTEVSFWLLSSSNDNQSIAHLRSDRYLAGRRLQYINGYTRLAAKFSHPRGKFGFANHSVIKGSGKSGLTPLLAPQDGMGVNKLQRLEACQKKRLKGFTTTELERMEALAPLDMRAWKHGLQNLIDPMFNSAWATKTSIPRHRGAIPILGDHDGFWLVSLAQDYIFSGGLEMIIADECVKMENPMIKDMMNPVLQLASRMLVNEYQYSW